MDATDNTTIIIIQPPPPFPAPPRSIDLSPLEFILALIAVITIPALLYAFVFSIPCPPTFLRRRDRRSGDLSGQEDGIPNIIDAGNDNSQLPVVPPGLMYEKEPQVKEIGSECAVCLSVFTDGEDVKQLSECKHSFHSSCIDLWLNSHSNCPICRASVGGKRSDREKGRRMEGSRDDDLQQGLPDSTALV